MKSNSSHKLNIKKDINKILKVKYKYKKIDIISKRLHEISNYYNNPIDAESLLKRYKHLKSILYLDSTMKPLMLSLIVGLTPSYILGIPRILNLNKTPTGWKIILLILAILIILLIVSIPLILFYGIGIFFTIRFSKGFQETELYMNFECNLISNKLKKDYPLIYSAMQTGQEPRKKIKCSAKKVKIHYIAHCKKLKKKDL